MDPSKWEIWRWGAVVVLAVVGAASVVYVIGRLLALQVPLEITLDRLPPNLSARIEGNELGEYLPDDTTTLAQFKERLQAFTVSAVTLASEGATAQNAGERGRLAQLAKIQEHNRDVYRDKRQELYELAAYELEAERLTPKATLAWVALGGAGVAAVLSMVLFTLLTLGPSDASEQSSTSLVVGELIQDRGSQAVWDQLELQACEIEGLVPVVIHARSSEEVTVETLGLPRGCPHVKVTVPSALVQVLAVEPREAIIDPVDVQRPPVTNEP